MTNQADTPKEVVIEGQIDSVKGDRSANISNFKKILIRNTNNEVVEYNDLVAIGNPAQYLYKGFMGRIFAIQNKKGKYLIIGVETADGAKICDEKRRHKTIQDFKRQNFIKSIQSALGGAFFSLIIWVIFKELHQVQIGSFNAVEVLAMTLAGVSFTAAHVFGRDIVQFIASPVATDFLKRNGFNTATE